jgi:hypothetical protein
MIKVYTSREFKVFDFDIDYLYRPNDDIYQEILPTEITVTAMVPHNFQQLTFDEQVAFLKAQVIEALESEVSFDTDDAPEFAISDVTFCFEEVVDL